jgi:hypothetical protein
VHDPNAPPVAVKQLHWADGTPGAKRRFARERETLARLRHPSPRATVARSSLTAGLTSVTFQRA